MQFSMFAFNADVLHLFRLVHIGKSFIKADGPLYIAIKTISCSSTIDELSHHK